jgi:hypothetical protein
LAGECDCPSGLDFALARYIGDAAPTAAPSSIGGRVNTPEGTPLAGVVMLLSGAQSRETITDRYGNYRFDDADSAGFYTLTAQRANYVFTPASRSFSLLADVTDAVFTATATAETANPLDTPEFFIRQQYLDFLNREPEAGGLDFWTGEITKCGLNAECIHSRRVGVADAFFFEDEFQQTGAYVYRVFKAATGQMPSYQQLISDRERVIAGSGLDQSKSAFALSFVQRDAFLQLYPRTLSADQFVDGLLSSIKQNSGVDLSTQRGTFISLYDGKDVGRALILKQVADTQSFVDAEYNNSFVEMLYFGYLRRDPEPGGFGFWRSRLDKGPLRDVSTQHAMACSFITSAEYQTRFGSVITHSNRECPQ